MKLICPKCCEIVEGSTKVCPKCGFEIDKFDELDYEEKLIINLRHPVIEYRISAIRALALRGSEKAIKALEALVEDEKCVPVLLEVVEALAKIGNEESVKVLKKLANHKSKLVSNLARDVLKRLKV